MSSTPAQALLREAITGRTSVRFFSPTPVPDATLAEVLRLTQRAPTSFNAQSYVSIVLRDQSDREKIVDAMLGPNGSKVLEAPVVVVFAADLEPVKSVPRIQQLLRENGSSEELLNYLPFGIAAFAGLNAPSPDNELSTEQTTNPKTLAWAYKQTTFAAATFLYAAHASGLSTCPIEGFDDAKLRKALDIPNRYSVPVIVTCGYAKPEMLREGHVTPRLPPTEIFFEGKFGQSSAKIFE